MHADRARGCTLAIVPPPAPRPRSSDTAVLVFARSTGAEARAKPALADARASALAAGLLLGRVRDTVGRSGLPAVFCDESRQRGATFGERLAAAVADTFARGHARVVIVGGDCPDLAVADLRAAARAAGAGRTALGRDLRGGAYLLALDRGAFDPEAFAGLPWQTGNLAEAFAKARFGGAAAVELAVRRDVNDAADLRAVVPRLTGLWGWSRLRRRGRVAVGGWWRRVVRDARGFGGSLALRGPPVAV